MTKPPRPIHHHQHPHLLCPGGGPKQLIKTWYWPPRGIFTFFFFNQLLHKKKGYKSLASWVQRRKFIFKNVEEESFSYGWERGKVTQFGFEVDSVWNQPHRKLLYFKTRFLYTCQSRVSRGPSQVHQLRGCCNLQVLERVQLCSLWARCWRIVALH